MSAANKQWIFERTKQALQLLACPAETQIKLIPSFACVTDELALDLDHWTEVVLDNFRCELTEEQISSLTAIDQKFDLLSRGGIEFSEEFWTEDALRKSAEWEKIRQMAKEALHRFGWPVETPPATHTNL